MMVSGLTKIVKLPQIQAIATSVPTQFMVQAVAVATVVATDSSLVHWPTMACIAGPALAGVAVGVRIATALSDAALKAAFAAMVLALSPSIGKRAIDIHNQKENLDSSKSDNMADRTSDDDHPRPNTLSLSRADGEPVDWPQHALLHCACGATVGVLSGAVGIGVR